MIKLYVELSMDGFVANVATAEVAMGYQEAYLNEGTTIEFTKLQGYILKPFDSVNLLVFDEAKYDKYLADLKRTEDAAKGEERFKTLQNQSVLLMASDEDAYVMRYLYDEWQPNTDYKVGDRKRYGDNLYKCKQDHTSEEGPNRTPDYLPALWDLIAPEEPDVGTKDNPIAIPDPFSSMEYIKGKYYKQGDTLYLMNGPMVTHMEDGAKVSLTYKPSDLVGQYFTIVEEE